MVLSKYSKFKCVGGGDGEEEGEGEKGQYN